MKKIFFILGVALTIMATNVSNVNAQTEMYIGGTIALDTDFNSTLFKFAPEFGCNLNDQFAVGGSFELAWTSVASTTFIGINPYVRWSFFRRNKFSLFVDGIANFTIGMSGGNSSFAFGVNVSPGLALNITNTISLVTRVANIGVAFGQGTKGSFGINPGISLGIYYNFY